MRSLIADERGSSLPLMILFLVLSGLFLTGGVAASGAFLAQRDLQAGCDGAAIAGAQGFGRSPGGAVSHLTFEPASAQAAVEQYAATTWGPQSPEVALDVQVRGDQVIVTCQWTVQIPFGVVFAPHGVRQSAVAVSYAQLDG